LLRSTKGRVADEELMQLIGRPQATATVCGPEIVNQKQLARSQEDLLFEIAEGKATVFEEGPLMLQRIELRSTEVSGRIEWDQFAPLLSDFNHPAQNSFYRSASRSNPTKSLGDEPPFGPSLMSQQPSERNQPRYGSTSLSPCIPEQGGEASYIDRDFSPKRKTEVDVQGLKWSLKPIRRWDGEFADYLEIRHAILQGIRQTRLGKDSERAVPRVPAVLPLAINVGEASAHQTAGDLGNGLFNCFRCTWLRFHQRSVLD
jgi:hypothetical protein